MRAPAGLADVGQATGVRQWYRHYGLRIARVERADSGPAGRLHPTAWDSGT